MYIHNIPCKVYIYVFIVSMYIHNIPCKVYIYTYQTVADHIRIFTLIHNIFCK